MFRWICMTVDSTAGMLTGQRRGGGTRAILKHSSWRENADFSFRAVSLALCHWNASQGDQHVFSVRGV